MMTNQANSTRFAYVLSAEEPATCTTYMRMNNGFFLARLPKSKEKFFYSESQLSEFIRTFLIMNLFKCFPQESISKIIETGIVSFNEPEYPVEQMRLQDFVLILDQLFGKRFSSLTKKCVLKFYKLYRTDLQFVAYGKSCSLPSARNVVDFFRFMTQANPYYSAVVVRLKLPHVVRQQNKAAKRNNKAVETKQLRMVEEWGI